MKKINDCKEYFKDIFINCLKENAFEKSQFESTERARFEMFCETIKFVYGDEFDRARSIWTQEALNEFYSNRTA